MITWVLILQMNYGNNAVVLPYTYGNRSSCIADLRVVIDQDVARRGWCVQQGGRK